MCTLTTINRRHPKYLAFVEHACGSADADGEADVLISLAKPLRVEQVTPLRAAYGVPHATRSGSSQHECRVLQCPRLHAAAAWCILHIARCVLPVAHCMLLAACQLFRPSTAMAPLFAHFSSADRRRFFTADECATILIECARARACGCGCVGCVLVCAGGARACMCACVIATGYGTRQVLRGEWAATIGLYPKVQGLHSRTRARTHPSSHTHTHTHPSSRARARTQVILDGPLCDALYPKALGQTPTAFPTELTVKAA